LRDAGITSRQSKGFLMVRSGNARNEIFSNEDDDAAFEKVQMETQEQVFVEPEFWVTG
jgi:hypothetical protein